MALTELSYPVTVSSGAYQNKFPSQDPLFLKLNRKDETISSISAGTDSKVRITIPGTFVDIKVGQFVTWETDGYSLRSSRVLVIVSSSSIEVDVPFTSIIATNGFINYHRNYFVEARFVIPTSASNSQLAAEIITDYSQIPNQKNGNVNVPISQPADLLTPTFELVTGIVNGLFVEYKVQYRESYEGNREGLWVSPVEDIKIMLVHGARSLDVNEFPDSELTKRYVKEYPLVYSMVYSDVNDSGSNVFSVRLTQYDISKTELETNEIASIPDMNGFLLLVVDTSTFNEDTRFVQFSSSKAVSASQYDPVRYDPTQYA